MAFVTNIMSPVAVVLSRKLAKILDAILILKDLVRCGVYSKIKS